MNHATLDRCARFLVKVGADGVATIEPAPLVTEPDDCAMALFRLLQRFEFVVESTAEREVVAMHASAGTVKPSDDEAAALMKCYRKWLVERDAAAGANGGGA